MSQLWNLREFPEGVLTRFINSFELTDPVLWARASAYLRELSEKGNETKGPVSKPVGDKFFELRPHTDEIQLRLIYYFSPTEDKVIIFVNCFVKKTEQLPRAEKDLARKRREEREDKYGKKKNKGKHKEKPNGRRICH